LSLGPQILTAGPAPTRTQLRTAAIRIAAHIAAENPHHLDDRAPEQAGARLAHDPTVRDGLHQLLDALGIAPDQARGPQCD
jgi:hypothetical protein